MIRAAAKGTGSLAYLGPAVAGRSSDNGLAQVHIAVFVSIVICYFFSHSQQIFKFTLSFEWVILYSFSEGPLG